jgi:hypothetical protein
LDVDTAERKAEEYLLRKEKLNIQEVHATAAKFELRGSNWRYVVSGWVKHKDGSAGDFEFVLDEQGSNIVGWEVAPRGAPKRA